MQYTHTHAAKHTLTHTWIHPQVQLDDFFPSISPPHVSIFPPHENVIIDCAREQWQQRDRVCVFVFVCVYLYVCIYMCVRECSTGVRTDMYIYTLKCTLFLSLSLSLSHTHTHTHTQTLAHSLSHTHTHTYTHTLPIIDWRYCEIMLACARMFVRCVHTCICACARVHMYMCVCERERMRACVCLRVCERESEREKECVF